MGVNGDDFCRQPGQPVVGAGPRTPAAWIRGQGGKGVGSPAHDPSAVPPLVNNPGMAPPAAQDPNQGPPRLVLIPGMAPRAWAHRATASQPSCHATADKQGEVIARWARVSCTRPQHRTPDRHCGSGFYGSGTF